MTVFNDEEQNKRLDEVRAIQEESSTQKQAKDMKIPYINLAGLGINMDALKLVDETVSRESLVVCFAMVGKNVSVAVKSPYRAETLNVLNDLENREYVTTVYLASTASLEKAWARYADISNTTYSRQGLLDISPVELEKLANEIHSNDDIGTRLHEVLESKDTHKTSHIMEIIFGSAIGTKSSDVHIEPGEEHARLRFRQDGVLQDILEFPLDIYHQLNSRIKLLSEMKISNSVIAQDGRFSINYKTIEIEIRTSLIPGPYGESIVMRILNPEGLTVDFAGLGFDPFLFEKLQEEIKKPNGMILTTGPTGSGKTTTLYSILKTIYSPEIKILTIEDPIEYHLPGVTQTQTDSEKGYDFSNGLRAALRQDPDVVMVGEIRDKETATTAINASLTGHLVLSTLHTNNAAGAIPRMIELGINPRILPDALTVCMAQRLVRRLCTGCKKPYTLTSEQEIMVRNIIKNAEFHKKPLTQHHITSDMQFNIYTNGDGCETCGMKGYKGQVGLYEAILIDDKITDIIAKNPSERDIRRGSTHQGIFTMAEDAMVKLIAGVTSLSEIESVVDLTEDIHDQENNDSVSKKIQEEHDIENPALETINNLSVSSEHTLSPVDEIKALVNYLKLLESQQDKDPGVDAHDDIDNVEKIIINLLKKNDLTQLLSENIALHQTDQEIAMIMNKLSILKKHQSNHPDAGIAHHLEQVRNTIEKLLPKE